MQRVEVKFTDFSEQPVGPYFKNQTQISCSTIDFQVFKLIKFRWLPRLSFPNLSQEITTTLSVITQTNTVVIDKNTERN